MPYDLSDDSGQSDSGSLPATAPTGRASDILLGKTPVRGAKAVEPSFRIDRQETPIDGAAAGVLYIAGLIAFLGIAYLLWGVWSGALALPNFIHAYARADRIRIEGNLGTVESIVQFATLIALVCFLFLHYDDSSAGYGLVIVAIFLNVGIPWLSQVFLGMEKATPFEKTTVPVVKFFQALAWLPAVPGIILITFDLISRSIMALQQSKSRKKSLRFGQQVAAQAKRRNVFMGRCWNLPYCRESIRTRCPVYIKRIFPCWHYKKGCMCEESIAVLASAPDWKKAVAVAMANFEGKTSPHVEKSANPLLDMSGGSKIQLTWAERKQRCRECVIYNTHQEQKYKLSVALVFGLAALVLYQFNGPLIGGIGDLFNTLNATLGHMSYAVNAGDALDTKSISSTVAWFVLVFLTIIVISKLLQLVEYFCFQLKI